MFVDGIRETALFGLIFVNLMYIDRFIFRILIKYSREMYVYKYEFII